jgi:hypothetical protein
MKYEGAIYHIAARENGRGKMFFTRKDYEKFKESIAKAKFDFFLHAEDIISACCEHFAAAREAILKNQRSQFRRYVST